MSKLDLDQLRKDIAILNPPVKDGQPFPNEGGWDQIIRLINAQPALLDKIERLTEAVKLALFTIDGLADQQAMADDWWNYNSIIIEEALNDN